MVVEHPAGSGETVMLTVLTRLFMRAGPVRYAWRPAATRTRVRKSVAAADPPAKTDGAGSFWMNEKPMKTGENNNLTGA